MDWKLELVVVPVADQDLAKTFYVDDMGFDLIVDHRAGNTSGWCRRRRRDPPAPWLSWPIRTQPGPSRDSTWSSPTSSRPAPRSSPEASTPVRSSTTWRDVPKTGPDPERRDYNTFFEFHDPDGNGWMVQEVSSRP